MKNKRLDGLLALTIVIVITLIFVVGWMHNKARGQPIKDLFLINDFVWSPLSEAFLYDSGTLPSLPIKYQTIRQKQNLSDHDHFDWRYDWHYVTAYCNEDDSFPGCYLRFQVKEYQEFTSPDSRGYVFWTFWDYDLDGDLDNFERTYHMVMQDNVIIMPEYPEGYINGKWYVPEHEEADKRFKEEVSYWLSRVMALGAPPELVSRNTSIYSTVGPKQHKPYAGSNYNNGIYHRFTEDQLVEITNKYFRQSVKKEHPDHGGTGDELTFLIEAYKRAKRLIHNYYHPDDKKISQSWKAFFGYDDRKKAGICVKCANRKSVENRVHCEPCRLKKNSYARNKKRGKAGKKISFGYRITIREDGKGFRETMREIEKNILSHALTLGGESRTETAKILGLKRTTLVEKIGKLLPEKHHGKGSDKPPMKDEGRCRLKQLTLKEGHDETETVFG
jgi:hypothetical protein